MGTNARNEISESSNNLKYLFLLDANSFFHPYKRQILYRRGSRTLKVTILRPRWICNWSLEKDKKWLFKAICLVEKSFFWPLPKGISCPQISQTLFQAYETPWIIVFSNSTSLISVRQRGQKLIVGPWNHTNHRFPYFTQVACCVE
jgi:hypothetical protein